MSLTPLPHPHPPFREKYIFFALPSMNVPLPAELKFGENPAVWDRILEYVLIYTETYRRLESGIGLGWLVCSRE